MILAALGLEWRNLLRSPLRLIVLAVVLGVGWFTIDQGQTDVIRWNEAIAAGQEAQEESLEEVRGYFDAGVKGPEDRSWVDLSQPHWQDSYAATRLSREPAPLAGIAFASAESGAVTMRVNRFADPMVAQGNRIENPALAAAGGLDLVTVLALLLPLLILALGVEVGGYERAAGMLPLLRVQSGRDRSWIWARCLAVGLFTALVGLALALMATLVAGAGLGQAMPLVALILAYVGAWTALLGTVASLARNPSHGAVALGAAWIVLCVLIPSVGVERSASLAAEDFALDLTVDARDAGSAVYGMEEDALFASVRARFPSLAGKEPEPRQAGIRAAQEGLRIVGLEGRMEGRRKRGSEQARLVEWIGFASPTLAFTQALESLAGRCPEVDQAFRRAVAEAAAHRMEWAIAATWAQEPLTAADFEELVLASPTRFEQPSPAWGKEFVILAAWALLFLGGGAFLTRRKA